MSFDSPGPRWRRSAGLFVAAGFGVGVLLLIAPGQHSDATRTAEADDEAGLAVVTLEVHMEPGHTVRERYVGRALSRRTSHLGFTQGGLLIEVLVDEGDAVEAGQVMARLDRDRLLASRRELDAQVEETEARLALARLSLERTRTLVGSDSVSKQQYDEARFEEMALAARLSSVQASIERVQVDLGHSELRAPFAGRIVARSADEGTILAPGEAVLQLIESGRMEARFGVPPEVAALLRTGARYPVELEGQSIEGELTAVLDEVAADTRTVAAIVLLDPSERPIRHGEIARLSLETRRESPGFWVPITALSESRRGLWAAYVLVPDAAGGDLHQVERRELSLLHAESDRAFVRGTLQSGDQIVASGVHRLVPGQRVHVAPQTPIALGDARER